MKSGLKKLSLSAAFAASALIAGSSMVQAQDLALSGIYKCNGQPFSGEYIVQTVPTFAPITKEVFNIAANETLISDMSEIIPGMLLVTPTDRSQDCNDFMQKAKDTNLVQTIGPNWLMRPMGNMQP